MRLLLLLAIALAIPAAHLAAQCPDGTPPPCRESGRRGAAPDSTTIAVLYFENVTGDSSDAYVADGLTEAIITRLGQVERLHIRSRYAVQRLRVRPVGDLGEVARSLRVANVVTGGVRRVGNRLRITVELTRAQTGMRLWGDQYTRTDDDLLGIEEDVSRAVARAIAGRLLPEEREVLATRVTHSRAAYALMLRGNVLLAQRDPESVAAAVTAYQSALEVDSLTADVWARLALAYHVFVYWGWPFPGQSPDSILARGLAAADRALELDSLSSDAWLARGVLETSLSPRTYGAALPSLRRAVALNRRNVEAWHQLGAVLRPLGDDSAAAIATHTALDLEPDRAVSLMQLSTLALTERRYLESVRWLDSAVAVAPDQYLQRSFRAHVRLLLHDVRGARADAEAAVRLGRGDVSPGLLALAAVEAAEGDTTAARARIRTLVGLLPTGPIPTRNAAFLALACMHVGDRDCATAMLERARPRGIDLLDFLRLEEFDAIRDDPRVRGIVDSSRPTS